MAKNIRRLIAVAAAVSLAATAHLTVAAAPSAMTLDEVVSALHQSDVRYNTLESMTSSKDYYIQKEKNAPDRDHAMQGSEALPSKLDLRDVGGKCYVSPVKKQSPWQTCWSFSSVAAAETSIAYALGHDYNDKDAPDADKFDLSERHLAWISDPNIAWISIGIIGVWSVIGYNMVLFISGLQEIPGDYYEAAEIDGATGIRQFFHITVPLLSPTTFFIVQTRIIGALTIFDLMFMVMDKTNLALENTQSIVYLFYTYAFTNGDKGYGATIVMVLVVFIMLVTFILQRVEKKLVYHP